MKTIDFKYEHNHFLLTIDGERIGVVYEREHAELIARMCNQDAIKNLESQIENLKHDHNTKEAGYKMTLKKIYSLTHGSTIPTIKTINDLASICKL